MAGLKFTVDRPTINTTQEHDRRLAELDLRRGVTSVYRDRKGIYWTPARTYHTPWYPNENPIDDAHNIKRMVEIMKSEGLTYMSKPYDSDIYKSKQRIDLNKIDTFDEICRLNSTN